MPTTYAHWRFGADCIEKMPDNLKEIIIKHRDCFDLGVHGPDIFFYDLTHSEVSAYGSNMHTKPGREFFEKCKEVLESHEEKDAMMAYMLGFLSHFTLDSTCHGYVDRKKEFTGISHNLVESQWDRHVMELDGKKPNLVDRAESLKPNEFNAKVISYFHPLDQETILRTTKAQHTIIKLLNCKNIGKEKFFKTILHKIGMNDFADLFIGFEEIDACKDSNLRLDKLRQKALLLYPKLLKNLMEYIEGKKKLDKYFEHDFEPWPDYKDIKVLSYEEELKYKV